MLPHGADAKPLDVEPGSVVDAMGRPVPQADVSGTEPFIGQLMLVGFNFAPRGWALCDGQLQAIAQNQALFSLLGTAYGGDGRTTFGLPDLRGRSPIGRGQGPGLAPVSWGQMGGNETTTLSAANMPPHVHTPTAPQVQVRGAGAQAVGVTTGGAVSGGVPVGSTSSAGNGSGFSNRPPYLGMYWCVSLLGIYPSRN